MTLLLNNKPFHFTPTDVPCMIHGKEKSGASHFTMAVILDLLQQGHKVIFYSAYKAAREFLLDHVSADDVCVISEPLMLHNSEKLLIPMSGEQELFMNVLQNRGDSEYIIVVKNVEELNPEYVEVVLTHKKIVVSGDCGGLMPLKDHLFNAHILFSDIAEFTQGNVLLEQYQGYFVGKGVVSLK